MKTVIARLASWLANLALVAFAIAAAVELVRLELWLIQARPWSAAALAALVVFFVGSQLEASLKADRDRRAGRTAETERRITELVQEGARARRKNASARPGPIAR